MFTKLKIIPKLYICGQNTTDNIYGILEILEIFKINDHVEKELFYYLENSIIQTTCVVISSNNQDSTVVRSTRRITNVHLGEVSNSIDDSLFHMHVFSVRLLCNFFRAFSSHALSMKITERLSTYHPDRNSPFK